MTKEDYRKRLYEEVFSKTVQIPGGFPEVVIPYFEGHWPRFEVQLDMFEKHLSQGPVSLVYDLGTGSPFSSYWFHLTHGACVLYGCPVQTTPVSGEVKSFCFDFTRLPELEKADMIIATEVIEHLTINTYRVRQWLTETVKRGGHLLLSFPLGGLNAHGYDRDDMGDATKVHNEHIREYTEQTAREWYIGTGFDLVEEKTVFTAAYGGNIMNVLLRKRL